MDIPNLSWINALILVVVALAVLSAVALVLVLIPSTKRNLFPFLLSETEDRDQLWLYIHEREYPPVFAVLRAILGEQIVRVPIRTADGQFVQKSEKIILTVLADLVQFFAFSLQIENRTLHLHEPRIYWRHMTSWRISLGYRQSAQGNRRRGIVMIEGKLRLIRQVDGECLCFELPPELLIKLGLKDDFQLLAGALDRRERINNLILGDYIKNETALTAMEWFRGCFG